MRNPELLGSGLVEEVSFTNLELPKGDELGLIEMGVESDLLPDSSKLETNASKEWSYEKDEEMRIKMKEKGKESKDRPSDSELIAVFDGDVPGYRKDI